MKKIYFIIPSLVLGGAERIAAELSNYWTASDNKVSIFILQGHKPIFYSLSEKINLIIPSTKDDNNISMLNYFHLLSELRALFKRNPEAFFISFLPKANILALIAGLGTKTKLTVCERNIINDPDISKKQKVLRFLLYPTAWKISVQHQEIYTELKSCFRFIDMNKVYITPNPVRKLNEIDKIDLKDFFPLFEDKKHTIVLGVGRFTKVKAFKELLETFLEALKTDKNLLLALIGDGPELNNCMKFAADNDMMQYVCFAGKVEKIDAWYNVADIFTNSSYYEGFPNVIAEALCAGLPVIAYDAPSIRVLVKESENGFIVRDRNKLLFSQKIIQLSQDPLLRKKMGEHKKEIIERLSIQRISDIWLREILI